MSDELGTLVIVVLKAKDLNDKYFWKQDVFAQVGLNGETKRTKVDKKGGQHPMWDEEIRLPIMKGSGDKFRKLDVSCWAQEPKKEDNIGQGYVDLTETLKTGEFDDWVKLESNGVSRGEIYLEMTFFTNAPAPVGHGLVVAQANLQRRPSKLSPADRLARPPYTPPSHRQQDSYSHHPNGLSPPSSRPHSNSPPRTGRESPLPPVPSHEQPSTGLGVPSTLTPGRPKAQGTPQHVPSILRPRNPKSSPTPIPGPAVEYTGVIPAPEYGESSPPRTYTPVVPPPDSPSYAPHPPERWGSNDALPPGGFSFPVPSIPGAREPTVEYSTSSPPLGNYGGPAPPLDRHGSGGSTSSFSPPPFQQHPPPPSFQPTPPPFQAPPPAFQAPPPAFQAPPPSFQHPPPGAFPPPPQSTFHPQAPPPANNRNDLPDPYLLARYQSPLPLPPGADKPSSHSQPALPPKDKDAAPVQSNPDNARLQALRQVEDETARRRAEEKRERERQAEEEARRREEEARRREEEAKRREEEVRRREEEVRRREEEARRRDEEAKRRKEQENSARLRALKQAEDEAARRRAQEKKDRELALKQFDEEKQRNEQEERDRELARQLDRELNLGEAAAGSPPRIPGQW